MTLKEYLKARGLTQTRFAARLKPPVAHDSVSLWCNGRRKPSIKHQRAITRATRGAVCSRDWKTP